MQHMLCWLHPLQVYWLYVIFVLVPYLNLGLFKLVLRHLDLHIALFLLQPKFGGKIIDIVSGDIKTPEQKAEAYDAVKNTIVEIFLFIIVRYEHCLLFDPCYSIHKMLTSSGSFLNRYTACFISSSCLIARMWSE